MGDDNWSKIDKLMSKATLVATCDSLKELARHQEGLFSVVLHGGEPLLMGPSNLSYLLEKLRTALSDRYTISIQSNGVLITEEILDICSRFRTSVAVSIDGPQRIHDKSRINHRGKGTFDEVMKGIDLLKSHPDSPFLYAGVLAVIDPLTDAKEVYSFFKDIECPSVDFLYKDGNHTNLPRGKSSINSIEYGTWMVDLLDTYLTRKIHSRQ